MLEATNRRIRLQLMASTERISSLERELNAARAAVGGGRHRRSVFTPYLPTVTEIEEMGEPSGAATVDECFLHFCSLTSIYSKQTSGHQHVQVVKKAATEMVRRRSSGRSRSVKVGTASNRQRQFQFSSILEMLVASICVGCLQR